MSVKGFGKIKLLSGNRLSVIVIIICVVLVLFLGVFMLLRTSINATLIDDGTKQPNGFADVVNSVKSQAEKKLANGDVAGAKSVYDTAEKTVSSNNQKSALLISKANISFNDGDYEGALTTAKQAEELATNQNVTGFIAQVYAKKGDIENALLYYQKTIDIIKKDNPKGDTEYYQFQIDVLNGTKAIE